MAPPPSREKFMAPPPLRGEVYGASPSGGKFMAPPPPPGSATPSATNASAYDCFERSPDASPPAPSNAAFKSGSFNFSQSASVSILTMFRRTNSIARAGLGLLVLNTTIPDKTSCFPGVTQPGTCFAYLNRFLLPSDT